MEWFKALIVSNLLFEPMLLVNSIDELLDIITVLNTPSRNITVVAYKEHLAWHLLETSEETSFSQVFSLLKPSESSNAQDFGYQQIYDGDRIAIGFSSIFEYVINANPHLDFHLARESYFSSHTVSLYSLTINETVKRKIDSVIDNVFESGLQDLWLSLQYKNRLNVKTSESNNSKIELQSIKGLICLIGIIYTIIIFILITEIYLNHTTSKHNQ